MSRAPAPQHLEDLRLVERMLAGDEQAFNAFGERYFRALYRFAGARLPGERDLVRELVQTTLAKALAKLDTYRAEAALLTWLCSCCRNEILMHFRRRRAAPGDVELGDQVEPAAGFGDPRPASPEAVLLGRERAGWVHAALEALPEHHARALEWKYLDRLAVEEIATRLGLGAKAAESLLTRARQAFRANYESLQTLREV